MRIAILAAAQMTKIEIYTFHSETYDAGYSLQILGRHKVMNGRKILDPNHIGSDFHNDVCNAYPCESSFFGIQLYHI